MTTIRNYAGTGTLNTFQRGSNPDFKSSTYNTKMIFEIDNVGKSFYLTIENENIIKVSMTGYLAPFVPDQVEASIIAFVNGISYTYNFTDNFNKCQVLYTGNSFNGAQIGTIENYNLVVL